MPLQLGQSMDNMLEKTKKTSALASEKPGAKPGCQEQKQQSVYACCTQHHIRVGKPPKPVLWPDPDTLLLLPHLRNQLTPDSESQQAREPATCFHSPVWWQKPPVNPCLNFLSGLLSISADGGRPGTLAGNSMNACSISDQFTQKWPYFKYSNLRHKSWTQISLILGGVVREWLDPLVLHFAIQWSFLFDIHENLCQGELFRC